MPVLKVVTFNMRYDCKEDGINQFPLRKPHILEKIQKESPDLIGFQELLPHMVTWLKGSFPDYIFVGCGRGADYQDEHNVIAYKTESFELFGLDTFWLSDTPRIPASRFEKQSICPRICTVATLKHKEMDRPIRYYNAHLDHEQEEARVLGMQLILERMRQDNAEFPLPTILTGDFNAEPDTEEIMMIGRDGGLQDFTAHFPYTYHAFGVEKYFVKIDYIFATSDIKCQSVEVWEDSKNGVYLSDHYPIAAKVVLE